MVTNIHEHKRYYYTLIIHYYLLRAFRTLTCNPSRHHNVRFLQTKGSALKDYVYAA